MKTKYTFFVTPRQVGKSTKQLYEFLKHKNKCLILTHNGQMEKIIKRKIRELDNTVTNYNQIPVFSIKNTIESIIPASHDRNITHIKYN